VLNAIATHSPSIPGNCADVASVNTTTKRLTYK
jgi:hypothetical protein